MDERIIKLLEPMEKHLGASEKALDRLRQYAGVDLPSDYRDFLRWSNGAEGAMWLSVPFIREKLFSEPPSHLLFSAEEVLTYTESPKDYARKWRQTWPDSLMICLSNGYLGLLNIHNQEPGTKYALGDPDAEEGEQLIIYQTDSFADLIEPLSTTLVDLTRADLRGADLQGVHLLNAILHYGCLVGADLRGADLRNACLEGADFTGAKLANIRLTGAVFDEDTRWPEGFNPRQHGAWMCSDGE